MLRRAPSLDAFRDDPFGSYNAGAHWIHAAVRSDLFAVLLYGRPNDGDMRGLVESLRMELGSAVPPHRSLVDASRIERVDLGAFEVLNTYVVENHARLSEQVTALSLVRPGGMEGAVVAGFFEVLEAPYPVSVFEQASDALAWLGASSPALVAEGLEAVASAEQGTSPLLAALRAYLLEHLAEPDMREASRRAGVSPRTLQRRLEAEGTTFQQEVMKTRLAEAERRMLGSDASLTAIAFDSGFATLQQFSTAFRKANGLSASDWRARHKVAVDSVE